MFISTSKVFGSYRVNNTAVGRLSACFQMKYSSQASKLNNVLNGKLPHLFCHVKLLNRLNSKLLKDKYDSLMTLALAGGGEKGIERHVKRNKKMLIRDRIKLLLDSDSETLEFSPLAGIDMEYGDVPCAGVVTIVGKVHGILCMVIGNDATVKSGSVYPVTLKKQLRAQQIAQENKLPCIYLVDSAGAFLPKQDEIFNEGGQAFYNQAVMSAEGIPQTAFVCGTCAAGGAYIPAMADESVILHRAGTIFLGGPPLVYAATGERVTAEELGGATLHCKVSGVTDHFASTEEEGLETTRDIIATLNLHDITSENANFDEPLHDIENLNDFAPSKESGFQFHPHFLLASILDGSRFHEFKSVYGSTLVTGFGFVKGHLAGFVASNGRLTGPAAVKGTHFVQLCSQRGLPIVFLQHFGRDCASSQQSRVKDTEDYSTILKNASFVKSHAQFMQAVACADVPSVAIATGGLIGSLESQALGSLAMGSRFQFVYPSVKVGGYYAQDLACSTAREEMDAENTVDDLSPSFYKRMQDLYEYYDKQTDAFHAAARVLNDGVILPTDTRKVLGSCLDIFDQESKFKSHLKRISVVQPSIRM